MTPKTLSVRKVYVLASRWRVCGASETMTILGIETSCDETGAALVRDGTKILSNIVTSSLKLHIKAGGIIPEVAAREQIKCIIPVIDQALEESFPKTLHHIPYTIHCIDAIAVTVGPGLIGSLLVGTETAKTLAYLWEKPIIPVNHLTAHLYANWLELVPKHPSGGIVPAAHLKGGTVPSFPTIGLIASGGHTDLLLMKGHGKLKWLGGTRDDAAGEAFDKIARLLGLSYPGGPAIATEAAKFNPSTSLRTRVQSLKFKVDLPRPLIDEENFDFSFSGLKTAVLREVNQLKTMKQFNNEAISYLSFEVQESITDVLVEKTIRAAEKYKVKSIILGGGVTANWRLREKFQSAMHHKLYTIHIPLPHLSTDNAAVIASCAYFNYKPLPWNKIQANPGLYF